jgi:hypothetical protein
MSGKNIFNLPVVGKKKLLQGIIGFCRAILADTLPPPPELKGASFAPGWRVSVVPYYVTTHPPAIFSNSIDTQDKLRLNLHSLSVSELLEYGRKF